MKVPEADRLPSGEAAEARAARRFVYGFVGVCGEHSGDPSSVAFFHEAGSITSPALPSGCPAHKPP